MSAHPYEVRGRVTVASAATPIQVDFPSRLMLSRLVINQEAAGAFTVDVYNRKLVGDAVAVHRIVTTAGGKIQVALSTPHGLRVDDIATVAGTTGAQYNGSQRVLSVLDDYTVALDVAYVADDTAGTVQLDIPTADWPLYQVLAQQTASGGKVFWPASGTDDRPFVNQDARNQHTGQGRNVLYLKVSATGVYNYSLSGYSLLT